MSTTIDPSDLDRDTIQMGDEEGRIYFTKDKSLVVPSVTTITNVRVDEDKKAALEGWRDRYDGSTQYKSPHWKDQLKFKGWRGTLAHFAVLNDLGDISSGAQSYFEDVGGDYSYEEYWAEYKLKTFGEYDGADAFDKAVRGINYFCNEFDDIAEERGITEDSVIEVETYVVDKEYGYGGQYDLLYENKDGETVLCDLKTSSGIRTDYKLQLAAYANAIDYDVDRWEVIRIDPSRKEVEVETDEDWYREQSDLYEQFLGLCYRTHKLYVDNF